MRQTWYICDGLHHGPCLYDAALADRKGMERCVKHGDILVGAPSLAGMSRKDARKKLDQQDAENNPYR